LGATIKHLKHDKRGVSNVIVVMLSLILIVIIVANVVLWSYQMTQFDWEKIQEKIEITNVERIAPFEWVTSTKEYAVNMGTHVSGTYTETWTIDSIYETFQEESAPLTFLRYNPSTHVLRGSTQLISGDITDLTTDNGQYMVFRSYPSEYSPQTLYAHREPVLIAGISYYQLKFESADSNALDLRASVSTTGRKLLGKAVYPLSGITMIPTSVWTFYYRARVTGPLPSVHCDVDILIRKSDNTIRTVIATDVANSPDLTLFWNTVSATYLWNDYIVEDETDFLEIDFYAHVISTQVNREVYLRIDDYSLPIDDQTRIEGVMLPSEYTVDIEVMGTSDTFDWQNLTWTVDSCYSVGEVNVTLQLYNYNDNVYPTSGDGFISYNSSATPNVDESKNQTINSNPENFRSPNGEWKIRIVGVKKTNEFFYLKLDWVEYKVLLQTAYRLEIDGDFTLDLSKYPRGCIETVEIEIFYRASDTLEDWFLKAYNWTSGQYSNSGFNSTSGHTPTTEFSSYTINLTDTWQSYVHTNGTIKVRFCDVTPDSNQTLIDIDFFGVRAVINGLRLDLKNNGPSTVNIVSVWVINATHHQRRDVNFFINSGENATYIVTGLNIPRENFVVKVITRKGNIAVYTVE